MTINNPIEIDSSPCAVSAGAFRWLPAAVAVLLAAFLLSGAARAADEEEEDEIPDPVHETLKTKDPEQAVTIKCTYYEGLNGKETVPVLLVHGWEQKRSDFDGLATALQKLGHAIIVPDLRGHGDSGNTWVFNPRTRQVEEKTRDKMTKTDIMRMAAYDLEAVKDFLYEKNKDGELNIDALTVVGSEMGAVVAMNWIVMDRNAARFPFQKHRVGQFVKAFILVSPDRSFKALDFSAALRHPIISGKVPAIMNGDKISAMIIVGKKEPNAYREAMKVYDALKRTHLPKDDQPVDKKTLFRIRKDTELQGVKLLRQKSLKLENTFAGFINARVVDRMDKYFPWMEFERPK